MKEAEELIHNALKNIHLSDFNWRTIRLHESQAMAILEAFDKARTFDKIQELLRDSEGDTP